MPRNEELIAVFTREEWVFQDDDPERRTIIARLDNGQTIKGRAPAGHLEPGLTYRFLGHWSTHPRHGRQFLFNSFTLSLPHGEQATIKYLARMGQGHGLGKARARAIWDAYREDACEVIRTDPARVAADIKGIDLEAAENLQQQFERNAALESVTIELGNLLSNRGFGQRIAALAIKEWGEKATDTIMQNPYVLMRFGGAGFMRCDALYLELGLDPAALHRQGYCLAHAMQSDSEGHTWYPVEFCAAYLRRSVAGAKLLLDEAIEWAIEHDLIAQRTYNGKRYLAPLAAVVAERRVAEYIHQAQAESECTPLRWPDLTGCVARFDGREEIPGLSVHQVNEAAKATGGILGILAGSPGTGKTFALAQIVKMIQSTEGAARIAIAAPTGKAAVRATENLQNQGLTLAATTIHRLLKVVQQDGGDGGWAFERNEANPLELDFLFIDEVSMCDTSLLASLLAARPAGCHVLLIGDPDQLAPVGRGAPLRDLIAAGIPCGHLKEIRRNAGRIVEECARIRDDGRIQFAKRANVSAGENLVLVPRDSAERQAAELEDILQQFMQKGGVKAAVWDCQVLVPLNEKSELSRKLLNKRLQRLLNPNGETAGNCPFRVNDKIVCLQNGSLPLVAGDSNGGGKAGEAYVANGEIGEVIEVNTGYLVVQLTLPDRLVRVPRGKQSESEDGEPSAGCNFDLAYALSVHKMQGSEAKVVIVMLDTHGGARWLCDKHWLYTAISRAKKLCLCIGEQATAAAMVRKSNMWLRKTFLREDIEGLRMDVVLDAMDKEWEKVLV